MISYPIILGADTPYYLATLPEGATEPHGEYVEDRKVLHVFWTALP